MKGLSNTLLRSIYSSTWSKLGEGECRNSSDGYQQRCGRSQPATSAAGHRGDPRGPPLHNHRRQEQCVCAQPPLGSHGALSQLNQAPGVVSPPLSCIPSVVSSTQTWSLLIRIKLGQGNNTGTQNSTHVCPRG